MKVQQMKYAFLAAVAATAIATPALAQTASGPYVGIEGGVLFPKDRNVDATVNYVDPATPDATYNDAFKVHNKTGFDLDAIAGYNFGMFRLEGELGYKRANSKVRVNPSFVTAYDAATGVTLIDSDFDLSRHTTVLSAMVNGLVNADLGGFNIYGGGGVGYAKVKEFGDSDSAFAWQLIAGASVPVSSNVDVGLKYRYFRTGNLHFADAATLPDAAIAFDSSGKFSSHSVLASLIYKFGAPEPAPAPIPAAAPPPPPPPAPATQTCPDGSVILATDVCPAPPPPPPPPPAPPAGERG
ncbi:MAG: outer membrane protein [Sphingomicrobium sp.]